MYGLSQEGVPFQVFARRENIGAALVIRFECREGTAFLGLRKSGRTDPAPSAAHEEEEVDPAALRAGRFVHVLPSGQRQSYALSRLTADVTGRMPTDRWVELRPHTEYGFRYLVAPEADLDGRVASVAVSPARPADVDAPPVRDPSPQPVPQRDPPSRSLEAPTLPAPQTPMAPGLAESTLRGLTREQAVEHLRGEMSKVHLLQQRIGDLEDQLRRSRARERELLDLLARWP